MDHATRYQKVLLEELAQADRIDWNRAALESPMVPAQGGAKERARTQRIAATRARSTIWPSCSLLCPHLPAFPRLTTSNSRELQYVVMASSRPKVNMLRCAIHDSKPTCIGVILSLSVQVPNTKGYVREAFDPYGIGFYCRPSFDPTLSVPVFCMTAPDEAVPGADPLDRLGQEPIVLHNTPLGARCVPQQYR